MQSTRRKRISELLAVSSLAFAVVAVIFLVVSSDSRHRYTLRFATSGQLVPGNEVRIGGPAVGSVESIELGDDYVAEVEIALERRLREGTRAMIRTTSQSGIANRYVALAPGPEGGTYIQPGSTIDPAATTAPVDFDQLLDAFGPRTRKGLRHFIAGSAEIFRGRGADANEAFRYLWPALDQNRELFAELASDREALERLAREGALVFGVLANRREQLSALVASAGEALGAVAAENTALGHLLAQLPPTLSQTTR